MERLSTLDAQFLTNEQRETPMNMAFLALFDRTPPSVFERFKEHVLARLDALPVLKRRLRAPAGWYENPAWSPVENIDLEYHLRHSALPAPGTMADLRMLVARLHMVLLDRNKPLWQFYLIEGLEDGGFALYLKFHHSALDGGAAMLLLDALFDLTPPGQEAAEERSPPVQPKSIVDAWWESYTEFQRRNTQMLQSLPDLTALPPPLPTLSAPLTPFNVSVSEQRSIGTCFIPLAEAKAAAKRLGYKLNDIVLSVCAGALRSYLSEHNALPSTDLIAAIPVSLREPDNAQMNNQVSMLLCSLSTTLADPLERTAAIAASMQAQKSVLGAMKDFLRFNVSTIAAPIMAGAQPDLWPRAPAGAPLPGFSNVLISNVPGPKTTIVMAGARATHYFPVSIASHGSALNITVQSYADSLDFCVIACSSAVPDVQKIADFIEAEFAALERVLHERFRQPTA